MQPRSSTRLLFIIAAVYFGGCDSDRLPLAPVADATRADTPTFFGCFLSLRTQDGAYRYARLTLEPQHSLADSVREAPIRIRYQLRSSENDVLHRIANCTIPGDRELAQELLGELKLSESPSSDHSLAVAGDCGDPDAPIVGECNDDYDHVETCIELNGFCNPLASLWIEGGGQIDYYDYTNEPYDSGEWGDPCQNCSFGGGGSSGSDTPDPPPPPPPIPPLNDTEVSQEPPPCPPPSGASDGDRAYCDSAPPTATQLTAINAALTRMRALSPTCAALADAAHALLQNQQLRVFPQVRHPAAGGWSARHGDWAIISDSWVAVGSGKRPLLLDNGTTVHVNLDTVIAHEMDHHTGRDNLGAANVDALGHLQGTKSYLTTNSLACTES